MSAFSRGRRAPAPSPASEALIRGLMADRKALRNVIDEIERTLGGPVIFADGRKLVDYDWLVSRLRSALP